MSTCILIAFLIFTSLPGEDQIKEVIKENNSTGAEEDRYIDKLKCAAVTAISAAAVKAKLLADQEEDQIQQLATSLIEKQVVL